MVWWEGGRAGRQIDWQADGLSTHCGPRHHADVIATIIPGRRSQSTFVTELVVTELVTGHDLEFQRACHSSLMLAPGSRPRQGQKGSTLAGSRTYPTPEHVLTPLTPTGC